MNRKNNQVSLQPYGYVPLQKQPSLVARIGKSLGALLLFIGALTGIAIVGIVVMVLLYNAVGGSSGSTPSYSSSNTIRYEPSPKSHKVDYKVSVLQSGCHFIGATYEMPSGTAQKDVSACSDSTTVTIDSRTAQPGDFLYLSVQNDDNFTTIACQIFVDGRLSYETKSTGEYVIASCSGSL